MSACQLRSGIGADSGAGYSVVSIVTGLRLVYQGIMLRFLAAISDLYLLQSVCTSCEADPASYSVVAWVPFLGGKEAGL